MDFAGINLLVVLGATVASFVFGSIYYMALAKPWQAAVGLSEADVKAIMTPLTFGITAVAQLVMAYMLAGLMLHIGADGISLRAGLFSAPLIWVGFVLPAMVVNHRYQGQKGALTLIDAAHWLGVLLIQGVVIGQFG
ncbi:MAG: DUF1761 domain-containing protein [Alphaproteobacteria bacterium]|nr:DUF1761 domain-containing protein [Alphaproteobacteria bacterium]